MNTHGVFTTRLVVGGCYLTNILVAIRYGAQNSWISIKIQNIKKELLPNPYDPHVQAP
jgi:hypothetical protein